jgi:ribonuclease HI
MVEIYTDGSCSPNPGKGGWAYVSIIDNLVFTRSGYNKETTNNIMELRAVIEAIRDHSKHKAITVFSDSQYVVYSAQGKWKRNENLDLWKEYQSIIKNKKVQLVWIRRDSHPFNKMANKEANNARLNN